MSVLVTPAPPAGDNIPLTAADAVRDVAISVAWVSAAGMVVQQFQPFTYFVAHNAALPILLSLAIPIAEVPPSDPVSFTVSVVGRTADGRVAAGTSQIDLAQPV